MEGPILEHHFLLGCPNESSSLEILVLGPLMDDWSQPALLAKLQLGGFRSSAEDIITQAVFLRDLSSRKKLSTYRGSL